MSAQPSPPLNQGATDFESDSEYLGTPIDPPSAGQPHVADNGPLGDYYYSPAHYGSAGYAPGLPAMPQYRYSDSGFVGMPGEQSVLLGQTYYEAVAPDDCGRPADSTMTAYHWFGASQLVPSPHSEHSCSPDSHKEEPAGNRSGPSLVAAGCVEGARSQCPTASAQFPEFDGDPVVYGDGVQNLSSYSIARSRHPDLVCDTNVGYALLGNQRLRPSPNHTVLPAAASFPQSYYDEGPYSESPSDDSLQGDSFTNPGCASEQPCGYDGQSLPCQPHLDTHLPGMQVPIRHNVRFYQPPSCPYTYPLIDGPIDGPGYPADSLSAPGNPYHPRSVIHAPRPQQLHDLHGLHDHTRPSGDASALVPAHQVLSIPNGPMQPVPRPSSLIEDSPKKPLTLACFFCRKRKIACQSPPANAPDRTCNQCAKRKLKCVYPATSRRGIRPRVYDLQDDRLPRASAPLSL